MKLAQENIKFNELNLEIQANSPYNDGWTKQFYEEHTIDSFGKKIKKNNREF